LTAQNIVGFYDDSQRAKKIEGGSMAVREIDFHFIPARAFKRGRTMNIQSVIMHSSEGRKAGDIATLTGAEVSSHWYVTRVGEVFHFVDEADTAFHAGKVKDPTFSNSASIGIEQEHFDPNDHFPQGEDWPDIQLQAVANLCALIFQKHRLSKDAIKSHAEVAFPAGRKRDPFNYPFDKLFQLIDEAMTEEVIAVNIN
jgi:N-acetylmuramoyl-L-alanine amidase